MVIDSRQYSGLCTCGRNHAMETETAIVEAGCLGKLEQYFADYGITGFRTVIYDRNIYQTAGVVRPDADQEIDLDANGLLTDEKGLVVVVE